MNLTYFYIAFHDPIWVTVLSIVLFFPVRQMIWVLYVRKKQKIQKNVSEEEIKKEKKRATFTSILLCVVFSYLYVVQVLIHEHKRIKKIYYLYGYSYFCHVYSLGVCKILYE